MDLIHALKSWIGLFLLYWLGHLFILAPIGLGNGPHVLGNGLHVLGNGLHLLGYGPYVLGNEPHVKSHIRVLLFEIMSHLGLSFGIVWFG